MDSRRLSLSTLRFPSPELSGISTTTQQAERSHGEEARTCRLGNGGERNRRKLRLRDAARSKQRHKSGYILCSGWNGCPTHGAVHGIRAGPEEPGQIIGAVSEVEIQIGVRRPSRG